MSNAIDDKELDEYLSGGTQYSQRYRSISTDNVAAELDQLVLTHASATTVTPIAAAAEKRSDRRKPIAFWMRISAPIALAASIVLVVLIVIDSGVRYDSAPALHEDYAIVPSQQPISKERSPASTNSSPEMIAKTDTAEAEQLPDKAIADRTRENTRSAAKEASQAKLQASKPQKAEAAVAARIASADEATVAGNLQSPAPAAAVAAPPAAPEPQQSAGVATDKRSELRRSNSTTGLEEVVVTAQTRQGTNSGAGPRGSIPTSSFAEHEPSAAELAKQYRESDPIAWLAYIRELRTNGKSSSADREWKQFTKAYPTYAVDRADSARPKK